MDNQQVDIMKILGRLIGTWVGEGTAEFPTIATFHYREALTFTLNEGKPYLHYDQRTWRKDDSGKEMASHWETGFWRILPNDEIQLLCAQASGRVEVSQGEIVRSGDGFVLSLRSSLVSDGGRVEQTRRNFDLHGDTFQYSTQMQTLSVPILTTHVQARLKQNDPVRPAV